MRTLVLFLVLLLSTAAWSKPGDGVILIGPPGAGKGTQAVFLKERYHLHPLAPGDLLRAEVKEGTQLGKRAQAYMSTGKLVPDEIIFKMVGEQLDKLREDEGFLLDGFPRSKAQAEQLELLLDQRHRVIASVVLLSIQDELLTNRLIGRRVCATCRRSYHVTDNPPQKPGLCDIDGSTLVHRSDDHPEVIQKRLEIYHQSTAPVAEYYRQRGQLRTLDADQTIESLREQLESLLSPLLAVPALDR
jgi:adenylate kinase